MGELADKIEKALGRERDYYLGSLEAAEVAERVAADHYAGELDSLQEIVADECSMVVCVETSGQT